LLVKILDRKRADYHVAAWKEYDLLYEGGHVIEKAAKKFLPQKPAETAEWYKIRIAEFHYKNLAGAAIDEIAAATLQSPIEMNLKAEKGKERPEPDAFYAETLWPDPTGTGEGTFQELLYEALTSAMKKREAWAMIAFPESVPGFEPQSRGEQEAAGELRAQITLIPSECVVNVGRDEKGLASVMLRHRIKPGDLLKDDEGAKDKVIWTYLTRKTVQQWQVEVEPNKEPKGDDDAVAIKDEQEHRLAEAFDGLGQVPLIRLQLHASLWAMDRIGSLCKNELSKRNGLHWYETLCCYPQPYHKGEIPLADQEQPQRNAKRGAQYWLELEEEGEAGYLEPGATALPHLKDRLEQIEVEVYKALHNMAAAQGPSAAAQVQAAAAKLRDAVAKQILCERYAKFMRDFSVQIADAVSVARNDRNYAWEASGADHFDLLDAGTAADGALKAQGIPDLKNSPTFWRSFITKTALALLPDADARTRDAVVEELTKMVVTPPSAEEDPLSKEDE
jgi:hypothetical protein